MKIYLVVFILLTILNTTTSQEVKNKSENNSTLKLMSYNLKFASPTYKPLWDVRKEWQVDMIRKYSPDIINDFFEADIITE